MPVSLKQIRNGGGLVFLHLCEVCGAYASFGFEVSLRIAFNFLAAGDKEGAKRHLGKWFCREHKPQAAGDATA